MELMEEWRRHWAIRRRQRVPRLLRDRVDPLAYTDEELFMFYRFRRPSILFIVGLVEESVRRKTARSNPVAPVLAVCLALRFFATNAFFTAVGQMHGVRYGAVRTAVFAVADALKEVAKQFIRFGDLQDTKAGFKRVAGFANVIGCVDGTQVRIIRPSGMHEVDFINRKFFPALNIQAVCDHWFRIVDLVAKWPGSTHDSRIWKKCGLRKKLKRGDMSGFILGDSGYQGETFLLTPYGKTFSDSEEEYNNGLCSTRVYIEQTFGVLKRRFPVLGQQMRLSPKRACVVVVAVSVLHNIGIERGDIIPDDYEAISSDEEEEADEEIPPAPSGAAMREAVRIRHYARRA